MALPGRDRLVCKVGVPEGKEPLLFLFPPPFTNQKPQRFWGELKRKSLDVECLKPRKADRSRWSFSMTRNTSAMSSWRLP